MVFGWVLWVGGLWGAMWFEVWVFGGVLFDDGDGGVACWVWLVLAWAAGSAGAVWVAWAFGAWVGGVGRGFVGGVASSGGFAGGFFVGFAWLGLVWHGRS